MQLRTALLAASILALPAAALAQPVTGPYISLGVGPNWFQDQGIKSVNIGGVTTGSSTDLGKISDQVSVGGMGSVGWGFGNGFRVELQGDYLRGSLVHQDAGNGWQEEYGGFANGLYDFDLAPVIGQEGLELTLGVGVGYQAGQLHATLGNGTVGTFNVNTNNNSGNFAAQGIVGLGLNVFNVPGLALTAEYHFVAVPDDSSYSATIYPAGVPEHLSFKTGSLLSHVALVGIRYALWQPAPPPPPPPAPPPPPPPQVQEARTYLVFFDWDRADLTARARQIVAEAAQASTHVQTTRIEVNGYTDLSGTAAYNQRLSVRRAESVEAELIRDGVPKTEIDIHGYGESNPLVPTAKGVREPQNRRVEIILK